MAAVAVGAGAAALASLLTAGSVLANQDDNGGTVSQTAPAGPVAP